MYSLYKMILQKRPFEISKGRFLISAIEPSSMITLLLSNHAKKTYLTTNKVISIFAL